ncbi:MAG: hydroxymethylglutaryl-CoA synthase, partial [Ilumatobacter fluminis]
MNGIVAWGTYVPRGRLDRRELAGMFGVSAPGGKRSVAGPDEDALTMGVEAARLAVAGLDSVDAVDSCWFATSHAPMLDRGNAPSITAAIDLPDTVGSYDTGGSIRSGVATLRAASSQAGAAVAVLADVRYGKPGSDDEANGGDAAA